MTFALHSPAFDHGSPIPERHTRDGENISPPLAWDDPPVEAKSYALLVEDPDAPRGTFRHWAIYNIPATTRELPPGVGTADNPEALAHGMNDFGNGSYDGPQPPPGHGTHHYHFRLAALDVPRLDLPPEAKATDVWQAARPHLIGEAELVGTCTRT